jgi:hypothetical protein
MTRLAEGYYNVSNIEATVLGSPRNNQQIYTEQNLEALLVKGDIDVGFFYEVEHVWGSDSNVKFIPLPVYLDMSNSSLNSYYKKVSSVLSSN